jgi:hypothetical protein
MKLSPTMQHAITLAKSDGGRLMRFEGGYWSVPQWAADSRGLIPSFSTNTAHALVTRGVAEYTEWKENRNGRFAVALKLKN